MSDKELSAQPEEEMSGFAKELFDMVEKMTDDYPRAGVYGNLIIQHSCLNDERFSEDEVRDIVRDFVILAEEEFDWTDYGTRMDSVKDIFEKVMEKHDYPDELTEEGKPEIVQIYLLDRIDDNVYFGEQEAADGEYDPDDVRPVGENDMDTVDMAMVFACVVYDPMDVEACRTLGMDYDYEHHHMAQWFSGQVNLGEGKYSRKIPNLSARTTYNRLTDPNAFLWIAIVMGIHEDLINKACREMQAGTTYSAKCGIFRKIIPFDMILDQARDDLEAMVME